MATEQFDFDSLIGKEFDFYGCDNCEFKLDDTVYEAKATATAPT
jgi:hypothetical protein